MVIISHALELVLEFVIRETVIVIFCCVLGSGHSNMRPYVAGKTNVLITLICLAILENFDDK